MSLKEIHPEDWISSRLDRRPALTDIVRIR